jgi:hypothetical protein
MNMKMYLFVLLIFGSVLFITGCEKERPKIEHRVVGGHVVLLKGEQAGLPLDALPGVKTITFEQWLSMENVPETGLYLVDTDFIPQGLPERLKEEGLSLHQDGTLDSAGLKIALFIQGQVYQIMENQSSLNTLPGLLKKLVSIFIEPAVAADPYPFSYYSWYMWWRFRGGFCRDFRAKTIAEAWGPLQEGTRPHTRIEYIETRAQIGSIRDRDSCFDCDEQSSYVKLDIGCFWPAQEQTNGWHYANWKEGRFSANITWTWSN